MTRKVMNFERTPQADAQARDWVVRIDAGPLDPEERQRLQQWLSADADHPRLLDEHALLWAAASRARFPAPEPAAAYAAAGGFMHPRRNWRWGAGALAGAALAVVFWLGGPWSSSGDAGHVVAETYSTGIGEPRPVPLPDGSRTELDAASTLRLAYSPGHRRVLLERGAGLFDVAKDKSRPFEVVAGNVVVRAVGTRFLVQRRGDGSAEVTVYEGVVEVTRTGPAEPQVDRQPVRLGVGQVAVSAEQHTLVAQAAPEAMGRKLAWQQGRIEFERTPLGEALEEVNRYSPVLIRLGDARLKDMQVSGSFSTRDTQVFLRSLEQGFGLRVQRSGEAWLVSPAESH